jgi:hypothetical protein
MSAMNLNLLPTHAKFQAAKIKLQHQIGVAMAVTIILWITTVVVIVGWRLVTKIRVDAAEASLKQVTDQYQQMEDNIVTSQKLKYKAKMVGGVINDRFEYGKAFVLIQSLFPPGIVLRSYDLKEEGTFEIKGLTQTKENVDLLENMIIDINFGNRDKLLSAKMTSLALKGTDWEFSMEVALK